MRKFIAKYGPRNALGYGVATVIVLLVGALVSITLRGPSVLALLAAATSSLGNSSAILYFTPYGANTLKIGETSKIDVNINAHTPINAVGATIGFPQDMVEIVGISKENSFIDLWTEETTIREEEGQVHFSGGTLRTGGLSGVATALTLTIRVKKTGKAELHFVDADVLASNGMGDSLDNERRTLTYSISEYAPPPGAAGSSIAAYTPKEVAPPPSADLNASGDVTLADMSILMMRIFMPYDTRYDLNEDGKVNLADLSTLFSLVQKK